MRTKNSEATVETGPTRELLAAARGGDEGAFRDLVEPRRGELNAHCYRMLGSAHDAEDALQETLLRAWRGLPKFAGRSSFRSWLYRIATNVCLNVIARRPKRVLPLDYGPPADPHDGPSEPLTESVWLEPYPDELLSAEAGYASPEARYEQNESVELAFVAALQHLAPRQRAVLILRDVLGFSPTEISEALGTTPASVYSLLQRAHKTVDERLPAQTQQQTLRSLGDERLRRIVQGYVEAWENGDADSIVSMLTEDAAMAMPPRAAWFRGREAVGTFLAGWPLRPGPRWRFVPVRANGQLAFGAHSWDSAKRRFVAHGVQVLAIEGERISEITAFMDPELVTRFGLPDELDS